MECISEAAPPPSAVIRDFSQHQESVSESEITELAQRVLLPVSEVQMWLKHREEVEHNRKRGAAQAAITQKAKKAIWFKFSVESKSASCLTVLW